MTGVSAWATRARIESRTLAYASRVVARAGVRDSMNRACPGVCPADTMLLTPPMTEARNGSSIPASSEGVGPDPATTTVHLDRGYDHGGTQTLLDELGFIGEIARTGIPAPIQAGQRWVMERTHAWMNGYGKLRRCTEQARCVVELYRYLAATIVVTRCLIQRARSRYRWDGRPTTRRLM